MGRISAKRKLFSAIAAASLTASAVFLLSTCEPIALKTTISDMVERKVVLLTPENEARLAEKTPELTFSSLGDAVEYQVQLSVTEDFADAVTGTATEMTYEVPDPLTICDLRYWRVRGVGADGTEGPWSETRSFEIIPSATPKVVWSEELGDIIFETKIKDDYAYVAAGLSGIKILDITDPPNTEVVGTFATSPGKAWGVEISSGDILYFTVFDQNKVNKLDVSNPSSPGLLGTYTCANNIYYVYDLNYTLLTGDGNSLIHKIDKATMTDNGDYGNEGGDRVNHMMTYGGYFYYVVHNVGVKIRNANGMNPIGTYSMQYNPDNGWLAATGNYLFVAGGMNGNLEIVDISDPAHPAKAADFDANDQSLCVRISGRFAFVHTKDGLKILDITTPTEPAEIGALSGEDAPFWLFTISGNYLYGSGGNGTLYIIDLVPEAE